MLLVFQILLHFFLTCSQYKADEQQQLEQQGARNNQGQRNGAEQPLDVQAVLAGTVAAVEEDPNKEYNRVRGYYDWMDEWTHCYFVFLIF